jgi:outer membrane protein
MPARCALAGNGHAAAPPRAAMNSRRLISITQAQSIASGLPIYNASSGWQAVGAGTQLKYRINPTWATYGFIEYDKLVGPTANSPIVSGPAGGSNQWTLGIGLTCSFTMTGLPF